MFPARRRDRPEVSISLSTFPKTFLVNPQFNQGFAGWHKMGEVKIRIWDDGRRFLEFPDVTSGSLVQEFPITLASAWLTEWYFYLSSVYLNEDLIRIRLNYSDGTYTDTIYQNAAGGWIKKTITPTAGKYIDTLRLEHFSTHRVCLLGWITMVFATLPLP